MKRASSLLWVLLALGVTSVPSGCGPRQDEKTESGQAVREFPSGASFKAGQGITLRDETRKILGLEIADVLEEALPRTLELNIQVFTETHRFADLQVDHTGCQFHGSGFTAADKSVLIKPKQPVKFKTAGGEALDGFVVAVQKPLAHGEVEVIVGITTAGSQLKDGQFVRAAISIPQGESAAVIPESALLRTIQGTYVYAVNGSAYYRTPVVAGGAMNGLLEITDGLYAGDQVVTKPVETLWLIELRETKGGGHCH